MFNLHRVSQEGEARRTDYLKQAEKARLIKTAQASRPPAFEQLSLKCANLLIALGHRLKERNEPAKYMADFHANHLY